VSFVLLACGPLIVRAQSPCPGIVASPTAAADCAARTTPVASAATLDPNRTYTLTELIDLAEHNNPRTRIAWEHAKQRANELGVEKSAYFPLLVFQAVGGDQRTISQEVAFRVATAYYKLLTAQERLQATRETLKTAQTTQDAAEA